MSFLRYHFHFMLFHLHRLSMCFCTSMACYTSNALLWIVVFSFSTTFSTLTSLYIVYASTKCCCSASSSSDFSMHIKSTNVALGLVCSLAHQDHLLLCKNSTTNVLVIFVLNYCLHKLYLLIIHLPFYTFLR